jgi:hypothetical protein
VQPPLSTINPTAAPAPAQEKPLFPFEIGSRLVTSVESIVSTSDTHIAALVSSMGDALTSIVKKL